MLGALNLLWSILKYWCYIWPPAGEKTENASTYAEPEGERIYDQPHPSVIAVRKAITKTGTRVQLDPGQLNWNPFHSMDIKTGTLNEIYDLGEI